MTRQRQVVIQSATSRHLQRVGIDRCDPVGYNESWSTWSFNVSVISRGDQRVVVGTGEQRVVAWCSCGRDWRTCSDYSDYIHQISSFYYLSKLSDLSVCGTHCLQCWRIDWWITSGEHPSEWERHLVIRTTTRATHLTTKTILRQSTLHRVNEALLTRDAMLARY